MAGKTSTSFPNHISSLKSSLSFSKIVNDFARKSTSVNHLRCPEEEVSS